MCTEYNGDKTKLAQHTRTQNGDPYCAQHADALIQLEYYILVHLIYQAFELLHVYF